MRLAEQQLQQQASQERAPRKRGWDDAGPAGGAMPGMLGSSMPPGMPPQHQQQLSLFGAPPQPQPQGMQLAQQVPGIAYGGGGMQPATMPGGALSQIPQACFGKGAENREKGTGKGSGGPRPVAGEDGNWTCVTCSDVNFANRMTCHLCHATKELSVPGCSNDPYGFGDDSIDVAAGTALTPVAELEKELKPFDKFRWKVAAVFRKAANSLAFMGPLERVIDIYADKAFQQLATVFGDRPWMPLVDLTLIFDAAVKQMFPKDVLAQAAPDIVQGHILASYERAFDECRVQGPLWECVEGRVEGKKVQNKVYSVLEESRTQALKMFAGNIGGSLQEVDYSIAALPVLEKVQKFIGVWVTTTVEGIAKAHSGDPSSAITEDKATSMFQWLLQAGTLPVSLTRELGAQGMALPKPVPFLAEMVGIAYQPFLERAAKRRHMENNKPKTSYCYHHYNGWCGFTNGCMHAHSEAELAPHINPYTAPWSNQPPGKGMGVVPPSQQYGKGMW